MMEFLEQLKGNKQFLIVQKIQWLLWLLLELKLFISE
jgi:hypothetical protein